jgi:hypothetical protein
MDSIFKQPQQTEFGTVIASQRVGAKRRPMTGSAKQSMGQPGSLDCFVASAPRNDGKFRYASAFSRRDAPESCMNLRPGKQRAQGMPGARCARSLACKIK